MGIAFLYGNGGGGGSDKGQMSVKAPAGSTITLTNGKKTKTITATGGEDIIRGLDYGSWTVRAELDGQIAVKQVNVQFPAIEMVYEVDLYNAGDLCTELTGGFAAKGIKYDSGTAAVAPSVNYGSSSVTMSISKDYSCGVWHTKNKIDVTTFSKLNVNASAASGVAICLWSEFGNVKDDGLVRELFLSTGENSMDVSDLDGSYIVGIYLRPGQVTTYPSCTLTRMYLSGGSGGGGSGGGSGGTTELPRAEEASV